ncbi:CcdB family protein [Aquabacterium humicola]|uniref:CcdB family protein n=1 Tax=Aquabacterium humicola TaxID=3237377 RepID=UPI002542DCD8|nr:CcdB family protein [Rubrivivax pictus]
MMARFDVYANPFAPERSHTPFVLDMQNDHLGPIGTRVVIPLRAPKGFGMPAQGLNPVLQVDGKSVILDTASLAPVPSTLLKKPIANLAGHRDELLDALDTLFGAY